MEGFAGSVFDFSGERAAAAAKAPVQQASGPVASVASVSADQARSAAESELRTRRRRRSSPDAANERVTDSVLQERVNAAVVAQMQAVNSPEAWQALLCLPAHTVRAITGSDRWKLDEEEKKTLGLTGAAAGQCMMITNPKALAFAMLFAAVASIYGPRAVAQLNEMAEKKKKAAEPKAAT